MARFLLLVVILMLGTAYSSAAQSLIDRYRSARVEAQAERLAQQQGREAAPLPPVRIPTSLDSLMTWLRPAEETLTHTFPEPTQQFTGAEWRSVRRLLRSGFEEDFGQTQWAYLGNHALTPLDTSMTRVLRARFEAHFGSPTRRLQDVLSEQDFAPTEYIQFEYWLVVNDSIPVKIMDTGGPFDRGVVLATDERYRSALPDLRYALSAEIAATDSLAAYSDYYYEKANDVWYFTRYDGRTYITDRISEPLHLIRRRQTTDR